MGLGLSINQVMKCCVPLPAIIFSYLLEKKSYPWEMVFAVFVIAFGAALCVPFGSSSVTSYGMLLVIISTTMSGLRPVISALLMSGARDSGLSPIPLLWYDSLISIVVLLVVFLLSDERTAVPAYFAAHPSLGTAIILTGSSTAFLYNVVTFYLIKLTSALLHGAGQREDGAAHISRGHLLRPDLIRRQLDRLLRFLRRPLRLLVP